MLQAYLPPAPQAGGVGRQVDLLARSLVSRGHDVTAFVVGGDSGQGGYESVVVQVGDSPARRQFGVGIAFSRLDLSGFDAVHAHGDDWLVRCPRVRTFYGSALMEARTATSWPRRASQCCYYGLEWISSANRFCVAISAGTRRYLPLIRECVPCAHDPKVFFAGGMRTTDPSILFVAGTLEGRKRGGLLVQAFAQVRRSIPRATLTIVSEDQVDEPGVTCLTRVDADALGALYRSHWVLCSTSSYEGFGVPYVEAMASGLPVVTTPNKGASEVLREGEIGVIAPPSELANALIDLLESEPRRRRLSERGVDAARRYSIDTVTSQYEKLYAQVKELHRRGARHEGTRAPRCH